MDIINTINIVDIIIIVIIAVSCLRGVFKGLVISIFNITSFFIAAFGAAKLYPAVSDFIQKTIVGRYIVDGINNIILNRSGDTELVSSKIQETSRTTAQDSVKSILDKIALPETFKDKLEDISSLDLSNIVDSQGIANYISKNISLVIINVLSIVLIFFAIKFLLMIIANVSDQFMKLPVLNIVNSFGGGVLGFAGGILTVYIIFAVITLLAPLPVLEPVNKLIASSLFGKVLYNNNVIIQLIMGKKLI